jgi:hypothetical protein
VTSQPPHDRLDRHPTWMVQGVFDPDVPGQDFSYTVGLHDLGFAELHLWAKPTEGGDPGEDWAFSMDDRCRILNQLAFDLIDGRVGVGSEVEQKYDHGLATVTFRLDPPGDRETLEAYGIASGAQVLPVSWSLLRPSPGELTRMTPEAERATLEEHLRLVRTIGYAGRPPDGWRFPTFGVDPGQEFGPRTSIVLGRAAQLWSCADLGSVLSALVPLAADHGLTWPASVARALARGVGRTPAMARLDDRFVGLVDGVIEAAGADWDAALRHVAPELDTLPEHTRDTVRANARDWLAQATLAVLSVEIVGDVADRSLLLAARGPWLVGLNPRVTLPGTEWSASPTVIRAVRRVLRPLDFSAWTQLNAGHDRERSDADSDYNALCWRLTNVFCTSASGCPWTKLSDLPAGREFRQIFGRGRPWESFVEWASCLSTLMTYRARHSHTDIATFVAPVRRLLPDLERELDRVR